MSEEIIMCKALHSKEKGVHFDSIDTATGLSLQDQIIEDRKFGIMVPRNGKYFTFQVMDWNNKWMSHKKIIKAVTLAWTQAEFEIPIDVRKAKLGETPDFKVYFRKTEDDPNLTRNTLMYHYYPIQDLNNPLRGVCVVNTDWPWTTHGDPISMHEIDEEHYPPDTEVKGETIDFDQVYEHEGPGHGLGLSHSSWPNKVMSKSLDIMIEFLAAENPLETIPRLIAKYGKRNMLSRLRKRIRNWVVARFDNY